MLESLSIPAKSPRNHLQYEPLTRSPGCLALLAGTDFAQELPGINAEIVIIVPGELDGVLAHPFGGERLGVGLKDQQRSRRGGSGLSGTASGFAALVLAHGARTSIAQVNEVVMRNVAVVPFDVHARAGGQIHLHRLGIGRRGWRLKRGLHEISIA